MKLTVLGKYGPYPPAGGATSGYLVNQGKTNILFECGSGIISRLQMILPLYALDAIVLSHLHSDHVNDMNILRYALQQMQQRGIVNNIPLKVFSPDQPKPDYDFIVSGQNVFEMITIRENMQVQLGDIAMDFRPMRHPVRTYGCLIFADNKTLAYTGDTCLHDGIEPFAMGADMLLADTGLLAREKTSQMVPHLTTYEVGQIAAAAAVKRLICTHISPNASEEEMRREVSRYYPSVEIAQEMTSYNI